MYGIDFVMMSSETSYIAGPLTNACGTYQIIALLNMMWTQSLTEDTLIPTQHAIPKIYPSLLSKTFI